jgi:hypothetical protein
MPDIDKLRELLENFNLADKVRVEPSSNGGVFIINLTTEEIQKITRQLKAQTPRLDA